MGNVLVVVSDRKLPQGTITVNSFEPDIITYSDYYPFGWIMPGREGLSDHYRYGFNGKEKDDEIKGNGNSYDFGNRIQDPRLGRFLSIDRFANKFPYQSPYLFAGNSPIVAIDANGDSLVVSGTAQALTKFKTVIDNKFGGLIETNIDANGLVTLNHVGSGPLTEQQQAFLNELNKTIDLNTSKVGIAVLENDKRIIVGSFALEAIDIADIEKFGEGNDKVSTSSGALIHEITEQTDKQRNGTGFESAHNNVAIPAENAVNGSERVPGTDDFSGATKNPNGTISGDIKFKAKDLKNGGTVKTVKMTLDENNVKNVQQ